ncbi:MAG: DUF2235 domain-containing protein [Mesorhizobium sp.]
MPDPNWVLIFSDGTGQRGVREDDTRSVNGKQIKNTNVFQMYSAVEGLSSFKAFYDAGLGAPDEGEWSWSRTFRNLWSKATGWGITANIADCYEALIVEWKPGMRIGFFGFSRGAYTVRCLGGVLATCGVALMNEGAPISTDREGTGTKRRREIAEEAVAVYKIKEKRTRQKAGATFAAKYAAAPVMPDVIGVFDTVKALGLPGVMNIVNPYKHEFHDTALSIRVPIGLHALSIDENRKEFAPVLWDEPDGDSRAPSQIIEQCWFPGVHSDVGGGYDDDDALANLSLGWMLDRLSRLADLHLPIQVNLDGKVLGKAHDERTGLGFFWLPIVRSIRGKSADIDALCVDIEKRFDSYSPSYRPKVLARHPRVKRYFES